MVEIPFRLEHVSRLPRMKLAVADKIDYLKDSLRATTDTVSRIRVTLMPKETASYPLRGEEEISAMIDQYFEDKAVHAIDDNILGSRVINHGALEIHETFHPYDGGEIPDGFSLHHGLRGQELVSRRHHIRPTVVFEVNP